VPRGSAAAAAYHNNPRCTALVQASAAQNQVLPKTIVHDKAMHHAKEGCTVHVSAQVVKW
jgi:hypothetical protein